MDESACTKYAVVFKDDAKPFSFLTNPFKRRRMVTGPLSSVVPVPGSFLSGSFGKRRTGMSPLQMVRLKNVATGEIVWQQDVTNLGPGETQGKFIEELEDDLEEMSIASFEQQYRLGVWATTPPVV